MTWLLCLMSIQWNVIVVVVALLRVALEGNGGLLSLLPTELND